MSNEANYDASLKLLDEIVSLLPQDVSEILYLRAKMKLELNQKAEAIADLDAAIQADPLNSLKALLCRVKLQVDMNDGDHSQVTSDFREILRRETDAAKVYMATGVLKLTAGDPMFAVAYLNAAMEKSGNILNPLLPFYRGLAKVRMQNYNDALLDFDRAIEIEDNENITQRVVNLGLRSALHGILEDYDKALSDIKKAISMCMEMDDGGVPLCMILWEIRRKVQENLGLEEPSTGHDYIDFFDMMVPSTERLEHAIAIYDLTIRIEQEEHSIDDYLARGLAYVEIDKPEAGIADLTRVIEANPTCVKAYLARGKAYRQINQPDDSLNDFRKAIEIDPDCEDADHERALTLMESIQEE
jgi:tetratricopeptide (TPR) repeat protein